MPVMALQHSKKQFALTENSYLTFLILKISEVDFTNSLTSSLFCILASFFILTAAKKFERMVIIMKSKTNNSHVPAAVDIDTDSKKLLTEAMKYGIVNVEDVLQQIENMKNKEIIDQHPFAITRGAMADGIPISLIQPNQMAAARLPNQQKKKSILQSSMTIRHVRKKRI